MDQLPFPRKRRFEAWALGALALGLVGCSGAGEGPVQQHQAIAGGIVDLDHHNVFLLVSHTNDHGALCTATLIAPNLLLTARHCVSPGTGDEHVLCGDSELQDPYPASAFFTTNDPRPSEDSPVFHAAAVRVPRQGGDTCGYDIALIILKENVPANVSTPAVPRIDREVAPGELYTAVGYGVNEQGNPNSSRMQLGGLRIACEPGTCGEGVESTEFRGETGICSGDSGGPALDQDGKVVGVVSRGGPDCSTPVYGTVTAWSDFLIDTAKDAASLGDYEPPFWVTTRSSDPPVEEVPPPGAEGDPCSGASACETGLVCYASAGSSDSVCAATCERTADCGSGLVCEDAGAVSVCAPPSGSGDESGGCAVAAPLAPADARGWRALGAALALCALQRRARRVRH
jgi:hypothetical protein